MSDEPPSPDDTLVLRNIRGLRREMHAIRQGQIRVNDALNRLARSVEAPSLRMDERFVRIRPRKNPVSPIVTT